MAYSPENGSVPRLPSIAFAPGAAPSARSQPTRNTSGGGRSTTNRAGSVARRQRKIETTKPRDQTTGTALVSQAASFGLDRPYIPWNVYPTAEETTPATLTASATFVSLLTCCIEPQHPKIRVRVRVVMGAATAGEVRLVDRATGTVMFGPVAVPAAGVVETNLDASLISPSLSGAGAPYKVDVQGRVTSGGASLGLLVLYAVGTG
jgi:hypothetical protein